MEGEILRLGLTGLQRQRCTAEAAQQECQDAGREQRAADQGRAGLMHQCAAGPLLIPADISQDDVLDAADRPIHAMREGKVLAPASYREDEPVLLPIVERLRRLIRQPAKENHAGDPVKLAAGDLVELDGKPAILSIMALVPSTDRVIQAPGSEYLHISVDFITDALLAKIAGQYLLAGARLLPLSQPVGEAAIPLADSRGIDPIMPIVGIHPDADIIDHPELVAGLGIDDGIVPDGDAFLLALHRRDPIPHAVGEKDFLPLEGGAIRLHSGVKAKADDHGKRENGKRHHRQRDLER